MIAAGTIIDDRYRVISRLGSGGMADVYLARDQLLGREVAVKVLHAHFAEDQEFVERFRREASSAAALSHPNIVGIFDRGEWNGTYYIAMEYVPGRTLKQIVQEHGALDVFVAIELVLQILQAARFAHSRGVIHRDLKPQNVIVDEEDRARVTDFGIARAGASEMTMTGSVLGTAQYLSPEQAQGYPVTEASDLYSIGVILYELLTGVLPFEGETPVAIAFKQVAATPTPPSAINPTVPASLDAIVLKALAKDPADRYTTADGFIAALQHERERLTAAGGPSGLTAVGAAAAPPTMLAAAAPPSEPEEPPEDGEEKKSRRALWWALGIAAVIIAAIVAFLLLNSKHQVTVPSVVGQSEAAAVATLRAEGFGVSTTAVHSVAATHSVVRQSPAGGASADKGSRVELEISSGPSKVAVPEVVGLSEAVALGHLERDGFKVSVRLRASATVPSGRVIATSPAASAVAPVGSTVTVYVSSGAEMTRVPNVVGSTQASAEAALEGAKLTVGKITRVASSQTPGTVIKQSPAAGSQLKAGESVELTLAEGVTVPNLKGKSQADAERALRNLGLSPSVERAPTSNPANVGKVIDEEPRSGSRVPKGSSVSITIGEAEPATTTPATTTPSP